MCLVRERGREGGREKKIKREKMCILIVNVKLKHNAQLMYMCVFIGQLMSDEDTDWNSLAQSYELTGGLIRNAVLSAISVATKRTSGTSGKLTLSTDDLHKGAKLQLKYAPLPLPYLFIYMYINITFILSNCFSEGY